MAENNSSVTRPSTVCINNNVSMPVVPNNAHRRPVLVTPLSTPSTPVVSQRTYKALLKVMCKSGKGYKMFTLRNIDQRIKNCDQLKGLVRAQLKNELIGGDFDIGYISGSNMVSIRTQADFADVWVNIISGKNVILWCDGLKDTTKKKQKRCRDGNESDEEASVPPPKKKKAGQEEKEERVQSTIEKLRETHGSRFTPMQVRIWSEMITGGLHSSFEEPPTSSMFIRAGKGGNSKKKDDKNALSEAFTQAAEAILSAFSPRTLNGAGNVSSGSPAKIIEARSKCYKQLHDLSNLKESGVLTNEQYSEEKDAVLGILRKLKGD